MWRGWRKKCCCLGGDRACNKAPSGPYLPGVIREISARHEPLPGASDDHFEAGPESRKRCHWPAADVNRDVLFVGHGVGIVGGGRQLDIAEELDEIA